MSRRSTKILRRKLTEEGKLPKRSMFEISVDMSDGQTAVAPIGWKNTPRLIAALQKVNAINPQVRITVKNDRDEGVGGGLYPLKQLMAYITFRRAGTYTVEAKVVCDRADDLWNQIDASSSCKVKVDANLFAPEPPAWLAAWAYWLAPEKARDECQFGRWVVFSVAIQPVLFLLNFLIRLLVTGWYAIHGMRDVHYDALWHMLRDGMGRIWNTVDGGDSFFTKTSDPGWRQKRRSFAWSFLMPSVWLLGIFTAIAINQCLKAHLFSNPQMQRHDGNVVLTLTLVGIVWIAVSGLTAGILVSLAQVSSVILIFLVTPRAPISMWHSLAHVAASIGMAVGISVFVLFILSISGRLSDYIGTGMTRRVWPDKRDEQRRQDEEKCQQQEMNRRALASLLQDQMVTRYSKLPRDSRTFYLGWQTLKREVCRPFQR